jgi:TonB-linked SusC/RagA family outer membrane protein
VWSGILNYDDKYSIQAVANYAGTYSFAKENRYQFFPSIGASWVISEEDFMKGIESVNYLKLRAETGILGYDNFQAPFYFRDNYSTNTSGQAFGPYSTNTWFGTTTENSVNRTSPSRIGNPNLSWEKRKEVNVGIDALLFASKLYMEVNYYNNLREGIISQITSVIPAVVGISSTLPRYNYNDVRYYGVETTLRYTDKVGDFKYSIGGNAAFQKTRYEKIDEPNYRYAYQSRLGQPIDGYWGLNYIGRFESDAETQLIPQLFDDELHTGDLKYKDMNGDGVVDDNDKTMIGNTSPRLVYAVNIDLKYKSFELSIVGTGRAFYNIPLTSNYFWNGWGDNNYSSFVRNNIGGAYPRLTYNKVNNNFIGSNFWLARGDHFKIQNIELAYNLPEALTKSVSIRNARIFVSGSNLLTLSKITDVDPESINSGVTIYPLFTNITGGIKLTF